MARVMRPLLLWLVMSLVPLAAPAWAEESVTDGVVAAVVDEERDARGLGVWRRVL